MKEFEILILRYTKEDLSLFDFGDYNIRILDIQSQEFDNYIKELNPKFHGGNNSFFNAIRDEIHNEKRDKKYAIVKNNPLEKFDYHELYKVYDILLVLFPSALQIQYAVHFQEENGFVQRQRMTTLTEKYQSEEKYLVIDNLSETKIERLNNLIKIIYPRLDYKNYIGLCYDNYYNSYTASHLHFAYITLCMSLENLVHGPQELSYRLKRISSIVAGSTVENCSILFKNLTAVYGLRSKIVHGESYSVEDVISKIDYLRGLVSRIIVELLLHNVKKNKDLGDIITTLGYGQRHLISDAWDFYELNDINTVNIYDEVSA
ncbi:MULTISPECIES: HEPN domain-containing protein [Chryseobacterium]|uniref:HEPN domain-containing protein n=1 Tax=Chryseobacterium TaxID=59732 RepID=UPI000F50FBE0|nr:MULTISPECIES: HEPN domain-containing protein [Chryseobacterium]AZB34796.1 hypothetical protein EG351_15040 [Chryseobacterium bernardetii]MBO9692652.1 hypothetical protein [Chryseobacterium sp.]